DKKDTKQYEQAAARFEQALKAQGIAEAKDLRLRALRGQARVHVRMNQWNLVQQDLAALDQFEEKALDSRTRAYRLALPILAAFATNPKMADTERLAQLAALKSEDREYLGKWEQDQLKGVFNFVVRGLELGKKNPKEALPLIEQLLAFDPQHLPTLMLK